MSPSVAAVLFLLFTPSTYARVFDFKKERIASYFGASYGLSRVGETPFAGSSGVGTNFDKTIATNSGGEIGVLISGEKTSLRLGGEFLIPRNYADIKGSNASGEVLFNLDCKVTAMIASAMLEFVTQQTGSSRVILGLGGGVGFVNLDNTYTFTNAGNTAFPTLADHTENSAARVTALKASLAYEVLFTDTVTAMFDLSYRYMPVRVLKGVNSVTTFTGSQSEGTDLYNHDGGNRTIDLSGGSIGLVFRFYIGS